MGRQHSSNRTLCSPMTGSPMSSQPWLGWLQSKTSGRRHHLGQTLKKLQCPFIHECHVLKSQVNSCMWPFYVFLTSVLILISNFLQSAWTQKEWLPSLQVWPPLSLSLNWALSLSFSLFPFFFYFVGSLIRKEPSPLSLPPPQHDCHPQLVHCSGAQ